MLSVPPHQTTSASFTRVLTSIHNGLESGAAEPINSESWGSLTVWGFPLTNPHGWLGIWYQENPVCHGLQTVSDFG